jgi:hypothetical protein
VVGTGTKILGGWVSGVIAGVYCGDKLDFFSFFFILSLSMFMSTLCGH